MIKIFSWFFLLISCSAPVKNSLVDQSQIVKVNQSENKVISLQCSEGLHCQKWNTWLEEFIKKSQKLKLPEAFRKLAPDKKFKKKYFFDLIHPISGIQISYADHHCLDGQISCTFQGENKIFLNAKATGLRKIEWMGIIWHEIFHLLYPDINHISCKSCSDKKAWVFDECDKNSFSSYGLERFWYQAYANKYSSDKHGITENKFLLKNLKMRICQ